MCPAVRHCFVVFSFLSCAPLPARLCTAVSSTCCTTTGRERRECLFPSYDTTAVGREKMLRRPPVPIRKARKVMAA